MRFDFSYYTYNGESFEKEDKPGVQLEATQIAAIEKYNQGNNRVILARVKPGFLAEWSFYLEMVRFFHGHEKRQGMPHAFSFPIITISELDIFGSGSKPVNEDLEIDPRFRFLDSSIWYRYVTLDEDFETGLENVLKTIKWAYSYKLYKKNVCKEYLEFFNRLLENSYLNEEFGGHAFDVYPFKFHLERVRLHFDVKLIFMETKTTADEERNQARTRWKLYPEC